MIRETLRPVWAEINLSNVAHNICQVKEKVGDVEIFGVVKADAYGHGAIEVSKILLENGVTTLAVATLNEALALREAGFDCPIVTLGIIPPMYADIAILNDFIIVTSSFENAEALSKEAVRLDKNVEAFIAVDTGMGRIGFLPNDKSAEEILKINTLPNINIKGIFSHFATADERDKTYAKLQLEKYEMFYKKIKAMGMTLNYRTFANSAAIMELPEAYYEAVRPGIVLYGCYPSSEVQKENLDIRPVMSIKANIVHLKKVNRGFSVSYGRKFTTKKESLIATLSLGYADGYPRYLSGKGRAIVNGVYAPIVGNICMDQCMVDVTDVPDVKTGDEVILMGSNGELTIPAEEIADNTQTINYEILCRFGQRLPKVYIKEDEL